MHQVTDQKGRVIEPWGNTGYDKLERNVYSVRG